MCNNTYQLGNGAKIMIEINVAENIAYEQFQAGQKVRTKFGEVGVVCRQIGCCVWLCGDSASWHHPSNLQVI